MGDGLQPVETSGAIKAGVTNARNMDPTLQPEAASLDGAATPADQLDLQDRFSRLATGVSSALINILGKNNIGLKDMNLNGSSGFVRDSSIANWEGFDGKTAGLHMLPVDTTKSPSVTFEIYMPQKGGMFGKSSPLGKITEETVRAALSELDSGWAVTFDLLKGHQIGRGSAAKSVDRLTVAVKQGSTASEA